MGDTGITTTSISEFERTKPKETMKAINSLIKKVNGFLNNENEPNIHLAYSLLDEVLVSLKDIRQKFKNGD